MKIIKYVLITLLLSASFNALCVGDVSKEKMCIQAFDEMNNKKYDSAISKFDHLIKINPDDAMYYLGRAQAVFLKHDIWHTKENYEKYQATLKVRKLSHKELEKEFMPLFLYMQDIERALELDKSSCEPLLREFALSHPVLIIEMKIVFGNKPQ